MSISGFRSLRLFPRRRGTRLLRSLIPAILLWAGPALAAPALYIVANTRVAVDQLDASSLRGIFGMRMNRWPDGTPIKVFVLPDNDPVHERFTKTILNTYPHQLRRNWDRMVFSGTGHAPVQVSDEQEMLEKIRSTPGSIGYVGSFEENDDVHLIEPQ